jgi:hypothetical protein
MTTDSAKTMKYVGITIKYNKAKHIIELSMPDYVTKALKRFGKDKLKGADSPLIYVPPEYGAKTQLASFKDESAPLNAKEIKEVQEIVGVFLFYARAVDPTMVTPISKIASKQAKPTQALQGEIARFLQYASKWRNAVLTIRASKLILMAHSDASYLSESEGRSRAGGYIYLGDGPNDIAMNAPISVISVIIATVVSSATEAEYAALFIVGQAETSLRHTLHDLGYPQDTLEIITDNLCAKGIAHGTVKQKRSKAIDMRYHWIRDQVKQSKFKITWKSGKANLADFFTKAHPVKHHKAMRKLYVSGDCYSSEGVLITRVISELVHRRRARPGRTVTVQE